jgi:N-acetylneuraminate lyase
MVSRFTGLIAAPYTPLRSDGSVNLAILPGYADLLWRNRVRTAFICGTTGEFASLSDEERQQLTEHWVRAAGDRLRVIVHVGHTALGRARSLAAHAAASGAAAIGCMAPWFFKPKSVAELVSWCEAVAGAAPALPFYYYHMPSMNGVDLPVAAFMRAAGARIPTFAGIKYSHEDLDELSRCVAEAGSRWEVLMGRDELLLEGLKRGVHGAVGSTYNYSAPLYHRLIEAVRSGNQAEAIRLQNSAIEMIAICNSTGTSHLAASKPLMAVLGVDCGAARAPLMNPTPAQAALVQAKLQAAGFSESACR